MEFEFNLANLGQIDPAFVCLEGEPHLGIGKTVIPPLPFEARILGFLSSFHAAEKGFERQIHPHLIVLEHQDLLQNLLQQKSRHVYLLY